MSLKPVAGFARIQIRRKNQSLATVDPILNLAMRSRTIRIVRQYDEQHAVAPPGLWVGFNLEPWADAQG